MRTENLKVKITIPIPFDKPDKNGCIYSKNAVENAANTLYKNLPITNDDGVVIGSTSGSSHIVTWDFDNQVCKVTVDGNIFYGGTECVVNEVEDGKITDFTIVGIGISSSNK